MNSVFKNVINLFMTTGFIGGLSFLCFQSCNWYGCNGWSSFFRADLICNACIDFSKMMKDYQFMLYGTATTTVALIFNNIISRDKKDSKRKDSPLIIAKDAVVLDNSELSINDQLDIIIKLIDSKF